MECTVIIGDVCQLREAFGSSRRQQDIIYIIEGVSSALLRHTVHVGFVDNYLISGLRQNHHSNLQSALKQHTASLK